VLPGLTGAVKEMKADVAVMLATVRLCGGVGTVNGATVVK
jgi:hypothetical protein